MRVARIIAMALASYRETGGRVLPSLLLAGGVLFLLIGLRLPGPVGREGGLSAAFFFGGLAFILFFIAAAYGSRLPARDRQTGYLGFLLSKPLSGAAYYLGRFLGLAARITLMLFLVVAVCGTLLALIKPDLEFLHVRAADHMISGGKRHPMNLPLLLKSGGPAAQWIFPASGTGANREARLRLRFRPVYPRSGSFTDRLPMKIRIHQGEALLLEREMVLKNRKSLELVFPLEGDGSVRVELRVASGRNRLEIDGAGCRLASSTAGPVRALLGSAFALLPLLLLGLALGLTFSSFVSTPTALFSTLALSLVVLLGPSMRAEIELASAKHGIMGHGIVREELREWERGALKILDGGLSLLPDPNAGGGLDPLAGMEIPERSAMLRPWQEGLPPLIIVVFLGCLLAGRRRDE